MHAAAKLLASTLPRRGQHRLSRAQLAGHPASAPEPLLPDDPLDPLLDPPELPLELLLDPLLDPPEPLEPAEPLPDPLEPLPELLEPPSLAEPSLPLPPPSGQAPAVFATPPEQPASPTIVAPTTATTRTISIAHPYPQDTTSVLRHAWQASGPQRGAHAPPGRSYAE
jgi:hypothetical protein